MAGEPHPQLRPILDAVNDAPNLETLGVEAARERFEMTATFASGPEVHETEDTTVPGAAGELDARIYRPGEGDRPVLVYFHGGGFVVGNIETHDSLCRALAVESGWTVVSVEYRLAPEHPFPEPLDDAYAATSWIANNPDAVGGDGTVAVGGDSAGANLSVGVSLLARDAKAMGQDAPDIAHQSLYYPVVGSSIHSFDSRTENDEGYFLERETMEWFHDQHIQSPAHARNEYLAPLLLDDLSGLPSATVITAGFDPLRDEGDAFAEALAADGVAVTHERYDRMVHGFASFLGMVDDADDALGVVAADLSDVAERS